MILELAPFAFLAGILTFLAPCTLPLVPGYLGFISGVDLKDINDSDESSSLRKKIFLNGLLYVIGFSVVFVIFGSLIGLAGSALAQHRATLTIVGGWFVILFGVFMLQSALAFYESKWTWLKHFKIPGTNFLSQERHLPAFKYVKPGNPISSLIFGGAFAVGWTPCVGPVLGSILTLAAAGGTSALQGAILLSIFSAGLALPFLILAGGIGYFSQRMQQISRLLPAISAIGSIFIIFLGILVVTNKLGFWVSFMFRALHFLNYEELLLDYL